jgi:amino-acid N-acetyltransferase
VIRPATEDDLPAIESALIAADLPVEGVSAAVDQFVVVDDASGGLIGAAGFEWHGGNALLRSVVVDPASRGTGVARALVAELLDRAAARNVDGVYLLTTTAERWFARLGFIAIERADAPAEIRASAEFVSICPGDATVMRRSVTREEGAV